ncbi:hypothetical protein Gpo141_00012467 [Globisporangium polare]
MTVHAPPPPSPVAAAAVDDGRVLRIPAISFKAGLVDAVQRRLLAEPSPASELLRNGQLQFVEMPLPKFPTASNDPASNQSAELDEESQETQWALTPEQEQLLIDATVVVADAHHLAPLLLSRETKMPRDKQHLLTKVQWVQATYAGVDRYLKLLLTSDGGIEGKAEKSVPSFTLTRAGAIKGMAQYVFGWIITLERKFIEAKMFQEQGVYAKSELSFRSYKALTVGVLGFGAIGQAIGRLLKEAGFQVTGFKRRPADGDDNEDVKASAHRVSNDLADVLSTSDYIVSILPSTPATKYLLNETNLAVCAAKQPVLINVGRGDVVSEQTMLRALDSGLLSKVVLDVFETEPLPKESGLWTHPRVLLTPHVSAKCFVDDVADVFFDNINLFLKGESMNYTVDWASGY